MGSKNEYSKIFDSKKYKQTQNLDVFNDIKFGNSKRKKKKKRKKKNKQDNIDKVLRRTLGVNDSDDESEIDNDIFDLIGIRKYTQSENATFNEFIEAVGQCLHTVVLELNEDETAFLNVYTTDSKECFETVTGYKVENVLALMLNISDSKDLTETELAIVKGYMERKKIIKQIFKIETSNLNRIISDMNE